MIVNAKNKSRCTSWKQYVSVGVMCFCLLFLTGANFLIYPPGAEYAAYDVTEAPMPVEEKNAETKSLTSIQEEYLHEHQTLDRISFNQKSLHKIHVAERLPLVILEKKYSPPKV
ncbi:MAG TPA: hypothetical protein PKA85_03790 [Ferruginibacter sp.]|nr:hypothetical protein [Ferruginibacter sp.]